MSDSDNLETVLDGLIATVNYCEDHDMDDLAMQAASLYQDVAEASPDAHWNEPSEDLLKELEDNE